MVTTLALAVTGNGGDDLDRLLNNARPNHCDTLLRRLRCAGGGRLVQFRVEQGRPCHFARWRTALPAKWAADIGYSAVWHSVMLSWRQDTRNTRDRRRRFVPDDGCGQEGVGPGTEGGRELVEDSRFGRQYVIV